MYRRGLLGAAVVAGVVLAVAAPAQAVTYKFYTGTTGYTGPYSGVGTVYDATKLSATLCPTTPNVPGCAAGGDIIADPMIFPGVTATAAGADLVWNDLAPPFAGLGVGQTSQPSDADQLAGNEKLTLDFGTAVILTGVGTLFAASHEPFDGFPTVASVASVQNTIEFWLSVDGGAAQAVKFLLANTVGGLSLVGSTFTFMQKAGSPAFYVAAVTVEPVPVPAALPLFATAVFGLGMWGRRRRRSKGVQSAAT